MSRYGWGEDDLQIVDDDDVIFDSSDQLVQIDRRELDGVDFTTYVAHVPAAFAPTLNDEHDDHVWRRLDDPPQPLHPGVQATINRAVMGDEYTEELHPRDKDGKWTSGGGGGATIDMSNLTKVSGKLGSNEGGVYKDVFSEKEYYVKTPPSKDHVQNELLAAKLYQLAGAKTLDYVPVKGGEHVATVLQPLGKDNVSKLTPLERVDAQHDFAVHAWLANWDAAGTGGDNVGIVGGESLLKGGHIVTLDTGGSLKYRAQGGEKGAAFGDKVIEINTLRDPSKNPDAAKLFGNMTNEQIRASIARVTSIPDEEIISTVGKNGGDGPLALKLIARKNDLAAQATKMIAAPASLSEQVAKTGAGFQQFGVDPIKQHLPLVKGTSAERVAWRKQLQETKDPAAQTLLKQKVLASFLKQHDKTFGPKKVDVAAKLAQYSQKYKMPNPLTQAAETAVTSAKPSVPVAGLQTTAAKINVAPPKPSYSLPSGYATYSSTEKSGYEDIAQLIKGKQFSTDKSAYKTATDYVEAAAGRLKYVQHDGTLTPVEAAHIVAYSGSQYRETNAALRAGTMTETLFKHVNALDGALGKLPGHDNATVYRKADLSATVAAKYQPGNVVTEWGFTSTSKNQGTWSGDYRYVIETKKSGSNAKDIVKLSSHGDSEAEVLFKSGSRFLVTKREGNKIHMREVG